MTALIQTRDALTLLGCTYRELDYGVRQGTFPCTVAETGSGVTRWFSVADLLTIRGVLERRQIAEELWPGKRRAG